MKEDKTMKNVKLGRYEIYNNRNESIGTRTVYVFNGKMHINVGGQSVSVEKIGCRFVANKI